MDSQNNNAPQNNNNTNTGINNDTLMGILSYLGPLVLIPYFTTKDNAFVTFHTKQGLVLLVVEAFVWFFGTFVHMAFIGAPLIMIVNILTLVLSIVGIINVINRKQNPLPVIGQFASKFNF